MDNKEIILERRKGRDGRRGIDTGYKGPERRRGERRTEKGAQKKPILAFLISLIIPGAGQIYNRELLKGFILFFLAVLSLSYFIHQQILFHNTYSQIMLLENVKELSNLYAQSQIRLWSRLIPLVLYLAMAVFSATDSYFFARYLVRVIKKGEEK